MPIEHRDGGTTLTGDSIAFFRLAAMRGAVGLELKGIKMTRGPMVWKRAVAEFQIPASEGRKMPTKQEVYNWLSERVKELRAQQLHVEMDATGREIRTVAGKEVQ